MDNTINTAQNDVKAAAELKVIVDYLISRDLLSPSYIKAANGLAYYAARMANARLAEEMTGK